MGEPVQTNAGLMTSAPTPESAASGTVRACFSVRAWLTLILVLAVGLGVDLGSKYLSFEHVADQPVRLDREVLLNDPNWHPPIHAPVHALPANLLDFRLVVNRGAVFGIGANRRFFFIAFTFAALVVGLFVFGRMTTNRQPLAHMALGLILAGGVGNLYDRIVYSVVRDFLHMLPGWHLPFGWRYPQFLGGGNEVFPWVFNVADVMLLTGMALLFIHINRIEKIRRDAEEKTKVQAASC